MLITRFLLVSMHVDPEKYAAFYLLAAVDPEKVDITFLVITYGR